MTTYQYYVVQTESKTPPLTTAARPARGRSVRISTDTLAANELEFQRV
jgi:hypothetical protein